MGEEPAKAEPARYRAFISYSHGDARFAHWLHRKLESWRLPDKSRLTPVFIDRAELAAGSDLSAQVREALEQSAALVVVCSPNARASRWVGQEIELFRALHPDRPVLAALIEGEPDEAFPAPLLGTGDAPLEPLAADFRKGHDGQRLGLLKLAAGLTALPLDRLVQRDAQARQRRVMAITAAALALVLVLSAALVIALRARAEAERQRSEAEGLVEFMLTDLRDKLEGVGRLEIMGSVNERVMDHYSKQELQSLPDDSLLRRAKLLHAMGNDDIRKEKFNLARAELGEAARTTAELLARKPDQPEIIFAHAQSQYWLGQLEFVRKNKSGAGVFWLDYERLAARLIEIDRANPEWRRELGYAEANLCALALAKPADVRSALDHCNKAAAIVEEMAARSPGDLQASIDQMTALAWLADAHLAANQLPQALSLRERQIRLANGVNRIHPSDARAKQALLVAEIGLGKVQRAVGQDRQVRDTKVRARTIARQLALKDPKNFRWRDWANQIENISR